jgi:putative transposase
MKAKRYTEEQIIGRLREAEAGRRPKSCGANTGSPSRRTTTWKAKYAGMTVSDARRLRELESENSKLKKPLAESSWTRWR